MSADQRTRAVARIAVLNAETKPYDQSIGPALVEVSLTEKFEGDINGTSNVKALQIKHDNGSAGMVSLQRFSGSLGTLQGSFVLQGSEIIDANRITATWFVVPDSGTGSLTGLRGEGGFQGEFGKGSEGTLDYWFE